MTPFKLSFHDLTLERDRLVRSLPSKNVPSIDRMTTGELLPLASMARCCFWAVSVFVHHRLSKKKADASKLWERLGQFLNQTLNMVRATIGEAVTGHPDYLQIMHVTQMAQARSGPDPFNVESHKTICYKGVRTISSYLVLQFKMPEAIAAKIEASKLLLINAEDAAVLNRIGLTTDEAKILTAALEASILKGDEAIVPIQISTDAPPSGSGPGGMERRKDEPPNTVRGKAGG